MTRAEMIDHAVKEIMAIDLLALSLTKTGRVAISSWSMDLVRAQCRTLLPVPGFGPFVLPSRACVEAMTAPLRYPSRPRAERAALP